MPSDAKWCQVMPRISASVKEAERQLRRAEKAARKEGRRPGRKRTQAVQVVQESRSLLGHRVSRRQKGEGNDKTQVGRTSVPTASKRSASSVLSNRLVCSLWWKQVQYCNVLYGVGDQNVWHWAHMATQILLTSCSRAGLGRPPCTGTEKVGNLRGSAQAPPLRSWRLSRLVKTGWAVEQKCMIYLYVYRLI